MEHAEIQFTLGGTNYTVQKLKAHVYQQPSTTLQSSTRKHLSRSDKSLNTRQDSFKLQSLWKASSETKFSCSNVILESNVTPNVSRFSDS